MPPDRNQAVGPTLRATPVFSGFVACSFYMYPGHTPVHGKQRFSDTLESVWLPSTGKSHLRSPDGVVDASPSLRKHTAAVGNIGMAKKMTIFYVDNLGTAFNLKPVLTCFRKLANIANKASLTVDGLVIDSISCQHFFPNSVDGNVEHTARTLVVYAE